MLHSLSLFGKTVDHLAAPSSATVDNFPCYQVRTMSFHPPHPAPQYEKKGKKKKGKTGSLASVPHNRETADSVENAKTQLRIILHCVSYWPIHASSPSTLTALNALVQKLLMWQGKFVILKK